MPSVHVRGAIEYALAFSTTGAGASFSIKTFIPLPAADAVPQTLILKVMSSQLASIYGYSHLRGLNLFTGLVLGAGSGAKIASELATFIPIAGPGANAITAFALHMSTGIVLILVFELLQEGAVAEDYLQNTSSSEIGLLLTLATEVLADVLRGNDGVAAVEAALEKFKVQSVV